MYGYFVANIHGSVRFETNAIVEKIGRLNV